MRKVSEARAGGEARRVWRCALVAPEQANDARKRSPRVAEADVDRRRAAATAGSRSVVAGRLESGSAPCLSGGSGGCSRRAGSSSRPMRGVGAAGQVSWWGVVAL